ncbi:lipoprotein [Streptomyces sp. TRM49041]|uniref:lipoprotein n=1 Tax=Streptomyces sp. TRM49041 TaxID=2603216 RepID=UPI0011F04345|nr:lipoprotein [Streptomyces sp. TRM49041]
MRRSVVAAGVAAALLTGCAGGTGAKGAGAGGTSVSPSASTSGSPSEAASPAVATPAVAASGGALGGTGSVCPLPVTFDVAARWEPERIKPVEDPDFRSLLEQGTVTVVCEIDAKPAGQIGFLRVWTGEHTDTMPRQVLEAFVADEESPSSVVYRDVRAGRAGGVPATEVTYVVTSELMDESRKARALAVMTPRGAVVLALGGLDTREHEEMLPAYELAKTTMTVPGG